ncbi:hypothetical protein HY68_19410 [Streptomyces sp. AcH 505]|uniref:hypothetical protein n=1 Tax=unclassified Streptomyces TaxID=2593676 RepID=UPI000591982F|nr:hypothetical protein [Streptomyces sp. NBC_00370]KIF70235.1 hypothetical protein HY68_19410 [Streptomyces sp. AcH 505]
MANHSGRSENGTGTGGLEAEISLAQLRGDCARMAPHWLAPAPSAAVPVPPSHIRGITVPAGSVRLIAGTAQYGE